MSSSPAACLNQSLEEQSRYRRSRDCGDDVPVVILVVIAIVHDAANNANFAGARPGRVAYASTFHLDSHYRVFVPELVPKHRILEEGVAGANPAPMHDGRRQYAPSIRRMLEFNTVGPIKDIGRQILGIDIEMAQGPIP